MLSLIYALIAAFLVSLLAFIGLITLSVKDKFLDKILIYLVSFSAGGLMGGAFFHLLPESIEQHEHAMATFVFTLVGFGIFFLIERYLLWHHCHDQHCQAKPHLGYINLIGDGVHNFIDGLIIIAAFLVNPGLGIAVTLSIITHEIPQEIGDFGVLLYSGFSKTKALFFNFLSGVVALLGVIIGYFLINYIDNFNLFIIPAAAGGFIYIAASDLIPEIHKHTKTKQSIISFIIFVIALVIMFLLKNLEVGH